MNSSHRSEFDQYLGSGPVIVWFRQDLRLEDNPALLAAVATGLPLIPLYIWSPQEEYPWSPGAASQVWLHQSLLAFNEELEQLGSRLIIRQGSTLSELTTLIKETSSVGIFWNRRYEPQIMARDKVIRDVLKAKAGINVASFNGSLLYEPWEIMQKNEKPYQVYTAFRRACLNRGEAEAPQRSLSSLLSPKIWPNGLMIDQLNLMPKRNWAGNIIECWPAGSRAAGKQLKHFVKKDLANYANGRNRPDQRQVSYLSPYLHLGQLSPKQIYHSVQQAKQKHQDDSFTNSAEIYLKEIVWREFAYYLLFHFPHMTEKALRTQYDQFPSQFNERMMQIWRKGQTGYPIVDAGMRELWQTGWMHNRVRMIVALFW